MKDHTYLLGISILSSYILKWRFYNNGRRSLTGYRSGSAIIKPCEVLADPHDKGFLFYYPILLTDSLIRMYGEVCETDNSTNKNRVISQGNKSLHIR